MLLTTISLATALAWICYFFALILIEAAIANTLFSGSGPFVVILASVIGGGKQRTFERKGLEQRCYVGLFVTRVAIVIVAVSGRSGLGVTLPWEAIFGSLSALVSGILIAASLLIRRRHVFSSNLTDRIKPAIMKESVLPAILTIKFPVFSIHLNFHYKLRIEINCIVREHSCILHV